jgi:hypothetical protein
VQPIDVQSSGCNSEFATGFGKRITIPVNAHRCPREGIARVSANPVDARDEALILDGASR